MDINICGIGIVSALGDNAEQTLDSIRNGISGIGPSSLLHSVHDVPVGEVKQTNRELIEKLGVDPDKDYSRTALLGMWAAKQALDDSGIPSNTDDLRIGLISSTSVAGMDRTERFFEDFMKDPSSGDLRLAASHECADSTEKIASHCGITGFKATLSTACSSAANAVMLGARMIRNGILDCVIAGGTDALCRFTLNGFNSLMILDREPCRPFDVSRAGLNLGEGAAYVVLTREGIGTKPYCRLSGYANTNDAFHQTASSPEGQGAYLAMKQALEMSGVSAGDIHYINAHGTGTPNNDSSEAAAIGRLFGEYGCPAPPVSSTKPYTGHTLAAAGGIEAVLSVLAIRHGMIYPTLNLKEVMPESPFYPQMGEVKFTGVEHVVSNSFGFGGSNSTLIFSK